MNHYIAGAVWAGLVIALLELVQAAAVHHLRRFGACALGGIAVAAGVGVTALVKRHKQLAASAAAGHETLPHLMTVVMVTIAVLVTVVVYIIATLRARRGGGGMRMGRRRRMPGPPPRMLPPGGGFYPGGF